MALLRSAGEKKNAIGGSVFSPNKSHRALCLETLCVRRYFSSDGKDGVRRKTIFTNNFLGWIREVSPFLPDSDDVEDVQN